MRSEMRLARAEISEQADRLKHSGGLISGGAVTGLLAAMCITVTCIAALALVMPVWAAALIIGAVLGMITAILLARARDRMQNFHATPRQTVASLKEDVEWLKQRIR
jgi:uncharacterized membrane protein YedE/YeeE